MKAELKTLQTNQFDKQKLKELIAEETSELHDIIDDTCGKGKLWLMKFCLILI